MTSQVREGELDLTIGRPGPSRRRRIVLAAAVSVIAHAAVLAGVFWTRPPPPAPPPAEIVTVSLIDEPAPVQAPAPPTPEPPSPPKPSPPHHTKVAAAKPSPKSKAAPVVSSPDTSMDVSDAQMASAATAGSAAGGRTCNMIQWLQTGLRRNPSVRQALSDVHRDGRATLVWNGTWIRSQGQEGEGLAIVREAVMVRVAFAPEACRADLMKGLVSISLDDAPGSPKLALGAPQWRWSDLLFPR